MPIPKLIIQLKKKPQKQNEATETETKAGNIEL